MEAERQPSSCVSPEAGPSIPASTKKKAFGRKTALFLCKPRGESRAAFLPLQRSKLEAEKQSSSCVSPEASPGKHSCICREGSLKQKGCPLPV
jgi:hypothetical protein